MEMIDAFFVYIYMCDPAVQYNTTELIHVEVCASGSLSERVGLEALHYGIAYQAFRRRERFDAPFCQMGHWY
jgi:hypothetical protein